MNSSYYVHRQNLNRLAEIYQSNSSHKLPQLSLFTTPPCKTGCTGSEAETAYRAPSVHSQLWHYALNMFQWWSVGKVSLIFSSLLRISKNEGLWFMSAAQHFSVNLKAHKNKETLATWCQFSTCTLIKIKSYLEYPNDEWKTLFQLSH